MQGYLYYLMHKDIPVTTVSFSDDGDIVFFDRKMKNPDHAPVVSKRGGKWLQKWWNNRKVPVTRDNIQQMLKSKGFSFPDEYLHINLGLSLTDCYWICPVNENISWDSVNLFRNQFKDDSLIYSDNSGDSLNHSPNGSLQGNIEKTWAIRDDKRYIIKGNRQKTSAESINEVIASRIHSLQGFENHVDYKLIHIKGKEYDYGCISPIFTSENDEFIPVYELFESEHITDSYYENLKKICVEYRMDKDEVQSYLDYLILTDYIMSQTDRHFNNIGILRDPDSLKVKGFAPIFDSGNSMYFDSIAPRNEHDMEYLQTKGFATDIEKMFGYVKDYSIVDLTKLPSSDFIISLYEKDSKSDPMHIQDVCYAYERRIDRCRNMQLGIAHGKPIYCFVPDETLSVFNKYAEDGAVNNQIIRCNHLYSLAKKQAKRMVNITTEDTISKAESILSKIIDRFEADGFSRNDLEKYISLKNTDNCIPLCQIRNMDIST